MVVIDLRTSGAVLSDDEAHRYVLVRRFELDSSLPFLVWVMLNPSTADAKLDDPTIRKCLGFTKRIGGYGGLIVVNLYAFRATDPKALIAAMRGQESWERFRVIGPRNDDYIREAVEGRDVLAAWGATPVPRIAARVAEVQQLCVGARSVRCLGLSKTEPRQPRHPLMIAYETGAEPFAWGAG
jgi:hypothetical protein